MIEGVTGGIVPVHPWQGKERAPTGIWQEIVPDVIYLPLTQGMGAPCRPVVHAGDRIRKYQLVGEAESPSSVRVHSGISGLVTAIREVPHPSGKKIPAVIIENDGRDDAEPLVSGIDGSVDSAALRDIVQMAGIAGMGGAAFPSHIKIPTDRKAELCILNGAECEPMLQSDADLMLSAPESILEGGRIIMNAVGARETIIAIESHNREAMEMMRLACRPYSGIKVKPLPDIYPMGGEKQLIQFLAHREVPWGKLTIDAGVLVFNVATASAIADAAGKGIPLTHRLCSVAGDIANPQTIRFPIGTLVRDVLAFCGGWNGKPSRLVFGGPMMGVSITSMDTPLGKATNGILAINMEHAKNMAETPCIQCNRCSSVCPMRLMPQFIDKAGRRQDLASCRRLHAGSCINCGCCSYVCPSQIPLAANIMDTAARLKSLGEEK